MAFLHGKGTAVYVDQFDMSAYFNTASRSQSVETAETTTFGKTAKTYIPGLRDGTITLDGLFDGAAGAIDETLNARLGTSTTVKASIILPSGSTAAVGDNAYMAEGRVTSYEVSSPVGDIVSATSEIQATNGVASGRLLLPASVSISATGQQASVDNTASSAYGYLALLHVTANTRSAGVTFSIEHSSDNSTFTSLASFTATSSSTVESQVLRAYSTTVNRYVRAAYTVSAGTGAISAAITLHRFNANGSV
jgi:hypothetical protein